MAEKRQELPSVRELFPDYFPSTQTPVVKNKIQSGAANLKIGMAEKRQKLPPLKEVLRDYFSPTQTLLVAGGKRQELPTLRELRPNLSQLPLVPQLPLYWVPVRGETKLERRRKQNREAQRRWRWRNPDKKGIKGGSEEGIQKRKKARGESGGEQVVFSAERG